MTPDTPAFEPLALLTTTVGSVEDARRLAREAVGRRLAACVQTEAVESHYPWDGVLLQDAEWRLVFKTSPEALPALAGWLRTQHPYTLPMLLQGQQAVNADYLAWVRDWVSAPPP